MKGTHLMIGSSTGSVRRFARAGRDLAECRQRFLCWTGLDWRGGRGESRRAGEGGGCSHQNRPTSSSSVAITFSLPVPLRGRIRRSPPCTYPGVPRSPKECSGVRHAGRLKSGSSSMNDGCTYATSIPWAQRKAATDKTAAGQPPALCRRSGRAGGRVTREARGLARGAAAARTCSLWP